MDEKDHSYSKVKNIQPEISDNHSLDIEDTHAFWHHLPVVAIVLIIVGIGSTIVSVSIFALNSYQQFKAGPISTTALTPTSEKKILAKITKAPTPTKTVSAISNWKTYTNKEFSFSIDVPLDTKITEKIIKPKNIEDPTCFAILKRTIGKPLNEGLFEIPICYFDNPDKLTLAKYDNSHSRTTDVDGITTPRLASPENKEVVLTSGTKASYQKDHYCVARCPRYIIAHEDKIFTLTAVNLRGNDEETFDQILSTFKFLDNQDLMPTISVDNNSVACTQEAKECPDGSYVSRSGPRCEFEACPE